MKTDIEKAVDFVVEKCKEKGIVVHRYNAKSSSSIYLKFDWGMAHSMRISDHKGIEKYHYRFNLIKGMKKTVTITYRNNNYCNYYPFRDIYQCMEDIIQNRINVLEKDGKEAYLQSMKRFADKIERLPKEKLYPFWKYGKRVV